jgi:hypothetical protein
MQKYEARYSITLYDAHFRSKGRQCDVLLTPVVQAADSEDEDEDEVEVSMRVTGSTGTWFKDAVRSDVQ